MTGGCSATSVNRRRKGPVTDYGMRQEPGDGGAQDLLIQAARGIGWYTSRRDKARDRSIGVFTVQALFTTITNVDFDPERIEG